MAGIQIALITIFLFFFIVTRTIWIRIIKDEKFRLEIHLPILALHLSKRKNKSNKSKSGKADSSYIGIISDILGDAKKYTVVIDRIAIPIKRSSFNSMSLVMPYGYQGLVYAAVAYLKRKTKRLILKKDAVISSASIKEFQINVTVKLRLYNLIVAVISFIHRKKKEKSTKRI